MTLTDCVNRVLRLLNPKRQAPNDKFLFHRYHARIARQMTGWPGHPYL